MKAFRWLKPDGGGAGDHERIARPSAAGHDDAAPIFPPEARAGAICPICDALFDGRARVHVAAKLREHVQLAHRQRIDPDAALALTVNVCECGNVGTVKLTGETGYICDGCAGKQTYLDTLPLADIDYGRPMAEAALEDNENPAHCLPVFDMPASIKSAAA